MADEKKYVFRPLNAKDVAPLCRIIAKIGVNQLTRCFQPETLSSLLSSRKKDGSIDKSSLTRLAGMNIAFEMASIICERIPACESEIFALLSNVSGMPVEEVESLEFAAFFEMVVDFIKKPEFRDFIKVVSKSFNLD